MPPVTCHLRYEIDPSEVEAFERFGRAWIALVDKNGGQHHGYFLPSDASGATSGRSCGRCCLSPPR